MVSFLSEAVADSQNMQLSLSSQLLLNNFKPTITWQQWPQHCTNISRQSCSVRKHQKEGRKERRKEEAAYTYISVPVDLPIKTIRCSISLFLATKSGFKIWNVSVNNNFYIKKIQVYYYLDIHFVVLVIIPFSKNNVVHAKIAKKKKRKMGQEIWAVTWTDSLCLYLFGTKKQSQIVSVLHIQLTS